MAELDEKARVLVKEMIKCSNSINVVCPVFQKVVDNLSSAGLIHIESALKNNYVLRYYATGSPAFLCPDIAEIKFNNLDFTRACRDAYAEQNHGIRLDVLKIIDLGL